MCARMQVCICRDVSMHACSYARVHVCRHVRMCACLQISLYACTCESTCRRVHAHVYACVHAFTNTCTNTHMHDCMYARMCVVMPASASALALFFPLLSLSLSLSRRVSRSQWMRPAAVPCGSMRTGGWPGASPRRLARDWAKRAGRRHARRRHAQAQTPPSQFVLRRQRFAPHSSRQ